MWSAAVEPPERHAGNAAASFPVTSSRNGPCRSDAVVLARVLHDWPDDDAVRILTRARQSTPEGGALYLVEMTLDGDTGAGGLLDLNMLVVAAGAERTRGTIPGGC